MEHAVAGEGVDALEAEATASGWDAEAALADVQGAGLDGGGCSRGAAGGEVDDGRRLHDHGDGGGSAGAGSSVGFGVVTAWST